VDGDASLTVLESYAKHHGKEDYEQEWSQYAALLRAVGDVEVPSTDRRTDTAPF